MQRHSYRITLEHLATPNGNGKLQQPLSFEVDNHDDIFAIAQKVRASGGLDSTNATALAVGLKLFTEVMLTHRNDPRFAALRIPMRDFIGQLKAHQPNIEKEAREQGAGSRGEGTERGIRPHLNENHLTLIGGLRPMFRSAPRQGEGVISPCSLPPSPCLFVEGSALETL